MLLVALCLATLARQANAPAPASAAQEQVATQELVYAFDKEKELDEFEVVHGTWKVSAGQLWCTSKGAREELRWRRKLSPKGQVTTKLTGSAESALVLLGGGHEVLVLVDRVAARVAVEADGRLLLERNFEAPAGLPLALTVTFDRADLAVRVGDDEALLVKVPGLSSPFDQLALLAIRSQPRFDELTVSRDAPPVTDGHHDPTAPALSEDLRLVIERATKVLEQGNAQAALEIIGPVTGASLPGPMLTLLQRIGLRDDRLRTREPLASLTTAAKIVAQDGSVSLILPLTPGWHADVPAIRRIDGPVVTLTSSTHALRVEIYRYDQKLKYWFGRDPRIVYSSGGGGPTLGRARADEERDLHEKSTFTREFEKSKLLVGGETTYDYELTWPDPAAAGQTLGVQEWFTLHRGDTWRFTVEGAPIAFELAKDDVAWLLATFRFEKG